MQVEACGDCEQQASAGGGFGLRGSEEPHFVANFSVRHFCRAAASPRAMPSSAAHVYGMIHAAAEGDFWRECLQSICGPIYNIAYASCSLRRASEQRASAAPRLRLARFIEPQLAERYYVAGSNLVDIHNYIAVSICRCRSKPAETANSRPPLAEASACAVLKNRILSRILVCGISAAQPHRLRRCHHRRLGLRPTPPAADDEHFVVISVDLIIYQSIESFSFVYIRIEVCDASAFRVAIRCGLLVSTLVTRYLWLIGFLRLRISQFVTDIFAQLRV